MQLGVASPQDLRFSGLLTCRGALREGTGFSAHQVSCQHAFGWSCLCSSYKCPRHCQSCSGCCYRPCSCWWNHGCVATATVRQAMTKPALVAEIDVIRYRETSVLQLRHCWPSQLSLQSQKSTCMKLAHAVSLMFVPSLVKGIFVA